MRTTSTTPRGRPRSGPDSPPSAGRRLHVVFAALVLLLGMILTGSSATAVNNTGAFELDGNPTTSSSDDWDEVCYEVAIAEGLSPADATARCSATNGTNGAIAVAWASEPDTSASIFTGGGSKDPKDPEDSWLWKDDGGLPDKDNLLHSFAARYSLDPDPVNCPAGAFPKCDVIFFGSDRYDNSGDAVQGFWFFQNKIELTNVASQGGFKFSGHHKNNDLLVISDFSNGGSTSTIAVHKWDTTCTKAAGPNPTAGQCSAENLRLLAQSDDANCATSDADAEFCGIVNPADGTAVPWSYTDKSGNSTYLQGEFFEGGINLSTLGLGGTCFASVASETRASTSPTATLKDFVLDNFGECEATLKTQVSDAGPVLPGEQVRDLLTVTSNNPLVTATGTVTWYLCGPISTGACDGTTNAGSSIGTSTLSGSGGTATTYSPYVNTMASSLAPGRYCFRAEWPGDSNFTGGPYTEYGGAEGTNECFSVKDTSSITTAQKWLPQDTATVTTAGGTAVSGKVVFSLYENGTCAGTAVATFEDTAAPFETNNTTYYTASKTVSWSAQFVPTDTDKVAGSTTTRCERSDLTINNSASDFPPSP